MATLGFGTDVLDDLPSFVKCEGSKSGGGSRKGVYGGGYTSTVSGGSSFRLR